MKQENIRGIVLDILLEIEKGEYSHRIIDKAVRKYAYLPKQDRAFLSKLARGSIEYRLQFDYLITQYSKLKINKVKPLIRNILRMSMYQILYMDKVPDSAACDEAVKLVKKRGLSALKGFVNAILRNVVRDKASISFDTPALKYSMPDWIIDTFKEYGLKNEEIEKVLAAFLENKKLNLRVNTSKTDITFLLEECKKKNIIAGISSVHKNVLEVSGFDNIEDMEWIEQGLVNVQDASSALAIALTGIKKGDYIMDLAAAPGGKSIHAADILDGTGEVHSFDVSDYKLHLIEENVQRTGFQNIHVEYADARILREKDLEKADLVIADLPCSGLGIIGRKPDIKYNMSSSAIENLALLQREILDNAVQYVKRGGVLLFSTCTISRKENLENRKYILDTYPEFKPMDLSIYDEARKFAFAKDGYIQLLPGIDACDGFFISLYKRE